MSKLLIYSDGGARGNPGPAAIGYVIKDDHNRIIHSGNKCIGIATNNVAEYKAVIEALKELKKLSVIEKYTIIDFYLDSLLVASQLMGKYKIKNHVLKELEFQVKSLERSLNLESNFQESNNQLFRYKKITYIAIPREENYQADELVNLALDENISLNR